MDLTLDASLPEMAERVLSAAPVTFALAALSMGGYVAFEILRQSPDRVTRLALFDTTAGPDSAVRARQRAASIEAAKFGRFAGVTPRLLSQLVHTSRIQSDVGDEVLAMATRVGRDAFLRQQTAILQRPDSRHELARIRVPTVIGVGEDDVLTPVDEAREMHAGIADSVLHIFPRCGHLPAMELPAESSEVLRRWLLA